jgi:hypothetical protein
VVGQALLGRYPVTVEAERLSGVVQAVELSNIVIEQSPPSHTTLKDIVEAARAKSPLVLGAYLGYIAGEPHSLMLFITVPLGMMVVSSAAGISKALDQGLNDVVKRFFKSRNIR